MAVIHDVMPRFELFQPGSIADAQKVLEQHGDDAWIMAGGLDSFDWLKDRIRQPKALVDLSGIAELKGVRATNDGIEIGAMTTLTDVQATRPSNRSTTCWPAPPRLSHRRRSATRERSAGMSRRTLVAGITGPAGRATAPAAISVTPIRRTGGIGSTRSSTQTVAWR